MKISFWTRLKVAWRVMRGLPTIYGCHFEAQHCPLKVPGNALVICCQFTGDKEMPVSQGVHT